MKPKIYRYTLIPFSLIYYIFISLRNIFYRIGIFRKYALDVKVISVGNITWGGTGKTPVVLFILETILKKRLRPAVLIRGYGNDEEDLFSRLFPGVPVWVGKDRVKNGMAAIARDSVDTLLLDDGFQYRRLKRDLDIVCIDAIDCFGNGCVIPAGSMREGLSSLKRADIFLITKVDLAKDQKALQNLENKLRRLNPKALVVKAIHKAQHFYKLSDNEIIDLGRLKNKSVVLISAIGNPMSFEKTALNLGLNVNRHFVFRDHHWYKKKELENIDSYCKKNGISMAITTEKDVVRLRGAGYVTQNANIFALAIKLNIIENEQAFYNRLFGIYNS
ncbi:tetraacyldisaccharide 4'-kinase [Candidatus Omnitrophota bacterium]